MFNWLLLTDCVIYPPLASTFGLNRLFYDIAIFSATGGSTYRLACIVVGQGGELASTSAMRRA